MTSPARPIPWSPGSAYRLTLLPRPDLPRPDPSGSGPVGQPARLTAQDRAGLLERHRRLALGADAGLALAVFAPLAWFASWPGAGPGVWFAVLAAAALWARRSVHRSIAGQPQRTSGIRRVLVVGSPDSTARMISSLDSMPDRRLVPIGAYLRLRPTADGGPGSELPVVEILEVVGEVSADTVVLADDAGPAGGQAVAELESALADRAVVLLTEPGQPGRVGGTAGRGRRFCVIFDWASAAVQSSWSARRRPR